MRGWTRSGGFDGHRGWRHEDGQAEGSAECQARLCSGRLRSDGSGRRQHTLLGMAQNAAQHLADRQWRPSPDCLPKLEMRRRVVVAVPESRFEAGPPTHDEVATAIAALARGKSAGMDGHQAEQLQLLDEGNQEWVTSEMRRWWANEHIPKPCARARVVSIYNKGKPQKLENYRPNSSLIATHNV